MNVADFLLARLAEDEAMARAATWPPDGGYDSGLAPEWLLDDAGDLRDANLVAITADDGGGAGGLMFSVAGNHIARHDPARVLRQVEAMRRVVEEHRPTRRQVIDGDGMETVESYFLCDSDMDMWPCDTLRALAAIWSDHADYDPDWRI